MARASFERRCGEGRALIAKQRDLIAKLRQRGFSTRKAEDILIWMVETQWVLERDYEQARQRSLARLKPAMVASSPSLHFGAYFTGEAG